MEALRPPRCLTPCQVYSPAQPPCSLRGTPTLPTLLSSGKVLVAGGAVFSDVATVLCEVYDPATNTFSGTGPLLSPRKEHSAVLLPNGQVCVKCVCGVCGGFVCMFVCVVGLCVCLCACGCACA